MRVEKQRFDRHAAQVAPALRSSLFFETSEQGLKIGLKLWGIDDARGEDPREDSKL